MSNKDAYFNESMLYRIYFSKIDIYMKMYMPSSCMDRRRKFRPSVFIWIQSSTKKVERKFVWSRVKNLGKSKWSAAAKKSACQYCCKWHMFNLLGVQPVTQIVGKPINSTSCQGCSRRN